MSVPASRIHRIRTGSRKVPRMPITAPDYSRYFTDGTSFACGRDLTGTLSVVRVGELTPLQEAQHRRTGNQPPEAVPGSRHPLRL